MAINLSYPLKKSRTGGFQTNEKTIDAVADDLAILVTTNHGDRPIHFDFGANLRKILFDPSDDVLTHAEDMVLGAIDKWMPFVEVIEIKAFNEKTDRALGPNELRIRIEFAVGQLKGALDKTIRS